MSPGSPPNPYDADYYAHSCGAPYRHDAIWLEFFGFVADHITRDIQPRTVFDAGCAMGFLVECLRQRGVEAWGVDISEYAIQNVQPEVRPYCWVGSVTDPLPREYDLIVCIEIVEHLTPAEGALAIQNICAHTEDVLFSSTPIDFTEPTHVNVQPPEYWAELFARSGFFRDVDFDATFISNWAMRFRKQRNPEAPGRSQVRRRGLKTAAQAALWKIKTTLSKRWIVLQDRLGWYRYARWVRENEPGSPQPLPTDAALRFSILIPVSQERLPRLAFTLGSLRSQTYPNWEACLVYEASCAGEIKALLAELPREAAQLIEVMLEPGKPEIENLRSALDRAQGTWVGVLDCGDSLSPWALAACVERIHRQPDAEIVYSDEDHLAQDGKTRQSPFFKPDWSPELLISVNYLRDALFKRDLFTACSAQGNNFEDIVYRCAEKAQTILHIPAILYHRSSESTSPAGVLSETVFSSSHFLREENITGHLDRLGLPGARLHFLEPGIAHATWSFEEKLISIVIPTRDNAALLRRCLESLLRLTSYRQLEILLVENDSQEAETLAYYEQLRAIPQVRLLEYGGSFNYSAANNLGARQARGDWLLFLNNDIEIIDPGWLEELCRWVSRPEVGAVGARLLYSDGSIQHAGIVIGMEGHASHVFGGAQEGSTGPFGSEAWYRDYSAVTGACLATRREVFESAGGFDEGFLLAFSDVDFCQRVRRQGYRVVYTPFARLVHHEGQTRHRHIPAQDIQRGAQQLRQVVKEGDPYYNPGLSYAVRIPTLRRPNEEKPLDRLEKIVRYN